MFNYKKYDVLIFIKFKTTKQQKYKCTSGLNTPNNIYYLFILIFN